MKSRCKLFFSTMFFVEIAKPICCAKHVVDSMDSCKLACRAVLACRVHIFLQVLRNKNQPFDVAPIVSKYQPFTTSVFVVVGSLLRT